MGSNSQTGSLAGQGAGLGLAAATGPVGLGVYAAGTLANYLANSEANKKKQEIAQQQIQDQAALHSGAMSDVSGALNAVKANPTTAAGLGQASAGDFAKATAGAVGSGAPAVQGASGRYGAAQHAAVVGTPGNTGVAEYVHAIAPAMATQQGTSEGAQASQNAIATAAGNVGALQSQSYADAVAGNLAQQSIQPNPYVSLAAGLVQGAGKFIGTSGWGQPNATPSMDQEYATAVSGGLKNAISTGAWGSDASNGMTGATDNDA